MVESIEHSLSAQTFNLYKLKSNCIEIEYHLFLFLYVGEFWQRGPVSVNGYSVMCVHQNKLTILSYKIGIFTAWVPQ